MMDAMLDQLSRIFGRRLPKPFQWLPKPFQWITASFWWALFIASFLSLWPTVYAATGIRFKMPAKEMMIPALTLLTLVHLVHQSAIARREQLKASVPSD
jgi:hypothetical protein